VNFLGVAQNGDYHKDVFKVSLAQLCPGIPPCIPLTLCPRLRVRCLPTILQVSRLLSLPPRRNVPRPKAQSRRE
jgi:hypothetical protein